MRTLRLSKVGPYRVLASRRGSGSWTGYRRVALLSLLGLAVAGCSVLDPSGEWSGKPVALPSTPIRAEVDSAPGSSPQARAEAPSPVERPSAVVPDRAVQSTSPSSQSFEAFGPSMAKSSTVALDDRAFSALFDLAERAYRSGASDQALRLFEQLARYRPGHPGVWFRIGNLRHRERDFDLAVQAYRRAADLAAEGGGGSEIRSKALANLAIVAVERARRALDDWHESGPSAGSSVHPQQLETSLDAIARTVSAQPTGPALGKAPEPPPSQSVVRPVAELPSGSLPLPRPAVEMRGGVELIRGQPER